MPKIGEALRTAMLANAALAAITNRLAQGKVPQRDAAPYVWYNRITSDQPIDVDGTPGLNTDRFTIECVSEDIDESIAMADAIRADFNGRRGDIGGLYVAGAQVTDKDDDYEYVNPSDEGLHITALDASFIFMET